MKYIKCVKSASVCLFLLMAMLAVSMNTALAQNVRKVTGTVLYQDDNQPVMGATVQVEGTKIAVSTDLDGKFVINNVPQTAKTIKVSFVGLATQTVTITPNMTIAMASDAVAMDEIMVVAYGTAKKSSFTGSASVVNAKTFENKPTTTVTNALVATTPGVMVASANGMPGSEPSIYIRGLSSINGTSTPLYVVDGMVYDNAISSINPDDIESMTILKDAASTTLYGAKAASGVIMITTKHGKKEKMSVRVKLTQGFTAEQANDYKKLNNEEYVTMYWEAFRNANWRNGKSWEDAGAQAAKDIFTTKISYNPYSVPGDKVVDANGKLNPNAKLKWHDTDWYDAFQRLGKRTEGTISVSGGTAKSDYFTSIGYTREQGYVIGSEFKRYTGRANVNSQITKFLKVGTNLAANLSYTKGNQYEAYGKNDNPFRFARYVSPFVPIYLHNQDTGEYVLDENGKRIYDYGIAQTVNGIKMPKRSYVSGTNPVNDISKRYDKVERQNINAKVYAEITFLKDFKFTLNGGVATNSYLNSYGQAIIPERKNETKAYASKEDSRTTTWTYNQLLSYSKEIGKHHVDVMLGHESYQKEYKNLTASRKGQVIIGDNYELANYTDINSQPNSYVDKLATEGYFARANYDYDGKYFFSASFRRDGSSVFEKDSRWGNFWSVGGGWRIDKEKFMENVKWIDYLKLRTAYGEVGNDQGMGYYPWRATYSKKQNADEAGYVVGSLGNKNLKWEVSRNFDMALEFEFLKRRIRGTVEYFNRQSSNLMFSIPLAPDTGNTAQDMNAGTMYNRGYEIDLTGVLMDRGGFTWELNVNASHVKNRITKLPVEPYTSSPFKIEEGHARYEYYLPKFMGVDPATGSSLYKTDHDQYTYKPADLVTVNGKEYTIDRDKALFEYCGISMPKVTGGITTNLAYKGFDLTLTFYYQLGGKLYDTAYECMMNGYRSSSSVEYPAQHKDLMKSWHKPGDVTNVPRFAYGNSAETSDLYGPSSRWLVSSNMLELTTVNFGYTFPKRWMEPLHVSNLRLYFAGDNLMLLAKRRGMYPRKNLFSGYTNNPTVYTPARVFTFGVTVDF